jgi:D-alanine-D-alanine ligase
MRVAVLAGGRSLERAVSQRSGARVELALRRLGHDPLMLDADATLGRRLADERLDAAIVAIHGRDGEDGTVQELLELAGVPYAGAGPAACVVASDKLAPPRRLLAAGLPTAAFAPVSAGAVRDLGADALLGAIGDRVGLPLVVKPARGGSSLGVRRVDAESELPAALLSALAYDDHVLCERFVAGREIAVTVLAGAALPAVEAIPQGAEGYDFDARYTPGATEFVVPAEIGPESAEAAVAACGLIGCAGFARVDLLLPAAGPPQILELNTVPGLTETSLTPLAAQAAGMTFEDLVAALLESAQIAPR